MIRRNLSDLDSPTSLLNIYAHLIGFLLGSVGIDYLLLNTCPFKQYPAVIILFLLAIIVYVISNLFLTFRSNPQMDLTIMVCVCHISAIAAFELLLWLLVSLIGFFLINLSLLVLGLTLLCSCNSLFQPSHPHTETEERQATRRTDIEAPPRASTT